jgi:glycosyltransferase involved in cell wall biosynthesis
MAVRPKYSIVLPTLNGATTLAVTLPSMLAIDRDDVEWLVSENHSNDDTLDLLHSLAADDERLRVVQPPERLPLGRHLEFAYQQARGRWLSHLGDDDHLLPWRFELLDQALDEVGPRSSLLRGDYVRYSWPEYPEPEAANTLDPASFDRTLKVRSGVDYARELLNRPHIHGGGAWLVRSDLAAAVRKRCGYFASPQHVEFFSMRAAAALAEEVALLGLPLFILGRHAKSSGTQYFLPKHTNRVGTWDWSFEDPETYQHSPLKWKSYHTLSLDAALAVQEAFSDTLGDVSIAWAEWLRLVHSEMMRLVRGRQLPPQVISQFHAALAELPSGGSLYWRWRTLRLRFKSLFAQSEAPVSDGLETCGETIAWSGRLAGAADRFHSIVEVPTWLETATDGAIRSIQVSSRLKEKAA